MVDWRAPAWSRSQAGQTCGPFGQFLRPTAESPGAGCGAGRDRMTRVLSRSVSVSRWRRWIRAWGRDEPATDEPAAWAGKRSAQGWARRPSRSRRLLSLCSFARVPAPRRIDDATRWASRTARFTSLAPWRRRAARDSSVHRTWPWLQHRSLGVWSAVHLKPQFRDRRERPGLPTADDHIERPLGRAG